MSTFTEADHPRGPGGKFAVKQQSEQDGGLDDRSLAGKPFMATVVHQTWIRGMAVDTDEETEIDITRVLYGMSQEGRDDLADADFDLVRWRGDYGEGLYEDAYADDPDVYAAGPYYVVVDEMKLEEWLEANPVWEQDGSTPHPSGGYVTVTACEGGFKYTDADGELHRDDGPAVDTQGTIEWRQHGQLHREHGPARVLRYSGTTSEVTWARNGHLHRLDGPAVVLRGRQEWWADGELIGTLNIRGGWTISPDGKLTGPAFAVRQAQQEAEQAMIAAEGKALAARLWGRHPDAASVTVYTRDSDYDAVDVDGLTMADGRFVAMYHLDADTQGVLFRAFHEAGAGRQWGMWAPGGVNDELEPTVVDLDHMWNGSRA